MIDDERTSEVGDRLGGLSISKLDSRAGGESIWVRHRFFFFSDFLRTGLSRYTGKNKTKKENERKHSRFYSAIGK